MELWKYFRDEANDTLTDSGWFKSKVDLTGKNCNDDNTKGAGIEVPLKYLSNFWRTIEMFLINYEISLILT